MKDHIKVWVENAIQTGHNKFRGQMILDTLDDVLAESIPTCEECHFYRGYYSDSEEKICTMYNVHREPNEYCSDWELRK